MNPQHGNYNENEQLEREEQVINQPMSPDEEAQLELDKRMAEADDRENDIKADGFALGGSNNDLSF